MPLSAKSGPGPRRGSGSSHGTTYDMRSLARFSRATYALTDFVFGIRPSRR
jgi:hypothetical protein